jgi:hypothetical protein
MRSGARAYGHVMVRSQAASLAEDRAGELIGGAAVATFGMRPKAGRAKAHEPDTVLTEQGG